MGTGTIAAMDTIIIMTIDWSRTHYRIVATDAEIVLDQGIPMYYR